MNEIETYNLIKQAHIDGYREGYATANNFSVISRFVGTLRNWCEIEKRLRKVNQLLTTNPQPRS